MRLVYADTSALFACLHPDDEFSTVGAVLVSLAPGFSPVIRDAPTASAA